MAPKAFEVFTTAMDIDEDLRRIALQEKRLQFDYFDPPTAWQLGKRLKEVSEARQARVVIDIQLHTLPLFYVALEGTTPDNPEWVRRKRNIVRRFFRSSYAIGLMAGQKKINLEALDPRDYAAHGGSFPILLPRTGCVGTITVSGLPQREDHRLVVETVAEFLGRDISDIVLAPA
ncbi:MAG TPA: heme-degrading domain-containing protein [Terrimicrobiaceae bacterium]